MLLPEAQLARRLAGAVEEDARAQAIDSTKKRAVAQGADYDTFQALVSAAHLRPLAGGLRAMAQPAGARSAERTFRPDGTIVAASAAVPFSSSSNSSVCSSSSGLDTAAALRSGAQFARAWRAAAEPARRLRLLQAAAAAGALPRLLRLELSSRLLEEAVACLAGHLEAAATEGTEAAAAAASLATAVLQAAAGAAGHAVAVAGLSLQGRQRLAGLEGMLRQGSSAV